MNNTHRIRSGGPIPGQQTSTPSQPKIKRDRRGRPSIIDNIEVENLKPKQWILLRSFGMAPKVSKHTLVQIQRSVVKQLSKKGLDKNDFLMDFRPNLKSKQFAIWRIK